MRNIDYAREKKYDLKVDILTNVMHTVQPLTVELDSFWPLLANKVSFQQFLSNEKDAGKKTIYFENLANIFKIRINVSSTKTEFLLECFCKKVDDRIMFHILHDVKEKIFRNSYCVS